jgi:hypothetical protein
LSAGGAPATAPYSAVHRRRLPTAGVGSLTDRAQCCVSVRPSASNRRSRRKLKASLSTATGVAAAALPRERTFDAGRAHVFYKMAASSYCPAPDVLAWDCPPCRATKLAAAVAPRIFTDAVTGASGFDPKPKPSARPEPTLRPILSPILSRTRSRCERLRRSLRRRRSHARAQLPRLGEPAELGREPQDRQDRPQHVVRRLQGAALSQAA